MYSGEMCSMGLTSLVNRVWQLSAETPVFMKNLLVWIVRNFRLISALHGGACSTPPRLPASDSHPGSIHWLAASCSMPIECEDVLDRKTSRNVRTPRAQCICTVNCVVHHCYGHWYMQLSAIWLGA